MHKDESDRALPESGGEEITLEGRVEHIVYANPGSGYTVFTLSVPEEPGEEGARPGEGEEGAGGSESPGEGGEVSPSANTAENDGGDSPAAPSDAGAHGSPIPANAAREISSPSMSPSGEGEGVSAPGRSLPAKNGASGSAARGAAARRRGGRREERFTLLSVVGVLPGVREGESVRVTGVYERHPTYGRQFHASICEPALPEGTAGMLRYLSSGVLKGIGPRTARKIVDTFGEDTAEILEKNPEYLSSIPGISEKKARAIGEDFRAQHGLRDILDLAGPIFGNPTALRIFRKYGAVGTVVLKNNPYALCGEVRGVTFFRADELAASLHFDGDSPERRRAGILAFLRANANENGHTCVPTRLLLPGAADFMRRGVLGRGQWSGEGDASAEDALAGELSALLREGVLRERRARGESVIFLEKYDEAERVIAQKLLQLRDTVIPYAPQDIETLIESEEAESGIRYAEGQKDAIRGTLRAGVMLLTGGPGTGKTTVIRAILHIFEQIGDEVALAAPTGRAAKRLAEATGREARTIHRLLEVDTVETRDEEELTVFHKDEKNPLECDMLIVDECSMIDVTLCAALLRALRAGTRLLLVGDPDQLPSVGPGNVLFDILRAKVFPTVSLTEIFRTAASSNIVTAAHAVRGGTMPPIGEKTGDFFFLPREGEEAVARTIEQLVGTRLPRAYGEGIREEIQVISPTKIGPAGTVALNARLQGILNPTSPDKTERRQGTRVFREGDKVMQTRNDYELPWSLPRDLPLRPSFDEDEDEESEEGRREGKGVFNGDIGTILSISPRRETMTVRFEERVAEIPFAKIDALDHAFAITVHKAQGSEYPVVILPICLFPVGLRTRELLYTALTRARKMVILVGEEKSLAEMVQNSRPVRRYTALRERLTDK